MTTMNELVEQWEGLLERIATLKSPHMEVHVCRGKYSDDAQRYFVLRYFKIGDGWAISADASGVSADEAFRALERAVW